MSEVIQYPWGPASAIVVAVFAAAMAANIDNQETEITLPQLTGAATLNLTVSDKVRKGAILRVVVPVDATGRTLTFGTKMSGVAYAVTASKTAIISFYYNGTNFVNTGAILNN